MGLKVVIKAEVICDYCKKSFLEKSWWPVDHDPRNFAQGFSGISRIGQYTYLCVGHDDAIKQAYLKMENPVEPTAAA